MTVRKAPLQFTSRLDELHRVVVVLGDARCDRKDVGVEDDVLGGEASLFGQQAIGALQTFDHASGRIGLAGFVECHHDHRRAIASDCLRLLEERLFPFL